MVHRGVAYPSLVSALQPFWQHQRVAHLSTMASEQPCWKVVRLRPEASAGSSSPTFRVMGMSMTCFCSTQHGSSEWRSLGTGHKTHAQGSLSGQSTGAAFSAEGGSGPGL